MTKQYTCIVCPFGCGLTLDTETMTVTGNRCPRGANYAKTEYTNPMRTVTSTVKCSFGDPVPVKTDRPIPLDKVRECMNIINALTVEDSICIGDVLYKDAFGSNITATANRRKPK